MIMNWSRWPGLVLVGVISVVSSQCTQSSPSAPSSSVGVAAIGSTNLVGDPTNSTPVAGVAKVCKSGNVSGTFTVSVVQGNVTVLSPITVPAGECRVVAEAAAGAQGQVTITETSAGLQSVTLQTCRNSGTGGACDTIENPAFSNGGTVEVFAAPSDQVRGATATFVNNVTPVVAQFVIGDVEPHAVGDIVNFWGPQWWKNNQMSGFVSDGVASFKGFATDSDNVCGGTWISKPGNSSNPPATIPSVIAIIVTDTVVKNGNDISGTIKQIVTVQQDGGYGPSPGHQGNGPVVSVVCQ
jgi:hypothetical protein